MTDTSNLIRIIQEVKPDEIYNLAAMSHVHVSFQTPEYTANVDALGTLRLLEAIRILNLQKKTKIYQASTSELYGKVQQVPQTEKSPFIQEAPMESQKYMPIGLLSTTEKRIIYLLATEFSSTMNLHWEGRPL